MRCRGRREERREREEVAGPWGASGDEMEDFRDETLLDRSFL